MTLQSTPKIDLDHTLPSASSQVSDEARAPLTTELLRNLHSTNPEPGDDPYRALERVETLPRFRASAPCACGGRSTPTAVRPDFRRGSLPCQKGSGAGSGSEGEGWRNCS